MSYCTDTDIRYFLSGDGLTSLGTDVIGTFAVSKHIEMADSLIDLQLGNRFDVPFGTTPPAIKSISTILASWKVLSSLYTQEIPSAQQFVGEYYKTAMEQLKMIADYQLPLPSGTAGVVITEKGSDSQIWSSTKDYAPIFNVDSDLNWKVDSQRLEDISSARDN
jgi:phage gp36-like protein